MEDETLVSYSEDHRLNRAAHGEETIRRIGPIIDGHRTIGFTYGPVWATLAINVQMDEFRSRGVLRQDQIDLRKVSRVDKPFRHSDKIECYARHWIFPLPLQVALVYRNPMPRRGCG